MQTIKIFSSNFIKLLLLFHFINGSVGAQSSFVKMVPNLYKSQNIIKVDSYYYGIGQSNDNTLLFYKADSNGNMILSKIYKGYDINGFYFRPEKIYSVKENGQNYFLLTSRTNNWVNDTSILNYPYLNQSSYVIKVNENGDTLWTMLYEGGVPLSFCLADDSNYIFAGGRGGFLLKANKNTGDTLWTKRYRYDAGTGFQFSYQFFNGVINQNNGYYSTGSFAQLTYNGPSGTVGKYNMMLSKLDYSGDLLWAKSYGDTNSLETVGITGTHDGGFAIIGDNDPELPDDDPGINFMLIRSDANGDTLWCRTYDFINGVDIPTGIVETNDFGFAIIGNTTHYDSLGNYFTPSVLLKVDSMGNIVSVLKYSYAGYTDVYPHGLTKTVTGYLFNDGFINQTDSNGVDCVSQLTTATMQYPQISILDTIAYLVDSGPVQRYYFHPPTQLDTITISSSNFCVNTSVPNIVANREALLVYPNPASNQLTISNGQLANGEVVIVTVFDVLGKVQLEQKITANTFDISTLAAGIYMLQVQQGDTVFYGRFVKE